MSSRFLSAASLNEWIARDVDDYVAKAVAFGRDLEALSDLKRSLRSRQLASTAWDIDLFVTNFQNALRGIVAAS